MFEKPHRRYNPLLDEWVLVSPQRMLRPWQGLVEQPAQEDSTGHDPNCYLCPGNPRASGEQTPDYEQTFIFENDFPALLRDNPVQQFSEKNLLLARSEKGICRVVCYSPDHAKTLSLMDVKAVEKVVSAWTSQFNELSAIDWIENVQIFENKGEMMGTSSPHPHCQIWATETIPDTVRKEVAAFETHFETHESCLLCDYLELELKEKKRVVYVNSHFAALVPFWAVWPFEVLILSRHHHPNMGSFSLAEQTAFAEMLKTLTRTYDALFCAPFPYTMGFHQQFRERRFHFHAHFYPPLLRSSTIRKHMVGYEMLCEPQRDLTPEQAADRLRYAFGSNNDAD